MTPRGHGVLAEQTASDRGMARELAPHGINGGDYHG
jgi:hypothetical protein